MKPKFQELSSDTAIVNLRGSTFKVIDLQSNIDVVLQQSYDKINEILTNRGLGRIPQNRFITELGFDGEVLDIKTGGWVKGKVRIRSIVEFCPDEIVNNGEAKKSKDESLDDIRRSL